MVKTGSKANSSKEIMIRTLRNEIQYQIDDWKRENINLKTSESDEADHDPPFRVLVELFQENFGEIKQSTQEQKKKYFNDETRDAWREFHKKNATLTWTPMEKNRPGRPPGKRSIDDNCNSSKAFDCAEKKLKKEI